MFKDYLSGGFVSACSGVACRSAGLEWPAIAAIAVVLALAIIGVLYARSRGVPALSHRRAHDHLIPGTPRRYRARRA
jgi:hypothetical protein